MAVDSSNAVSQSQIISSTSKTTNTKKSNTGICGGCGRGDRQRKEYGYQRGNTGDIYTDWYSFIVGQGEWYWRKHRA